LIAAASSPKSEYNLFENDLLSLRQIVQEAALEAGRSALVLPLPSSLVLLGLRLTAALRLPLPVNADNLAGFLANQEATHQSSMMEPVGSLPASGV
jgi:hypothetical protein